MKHLLLALPFFGCISLSADAQSIIAGQTSGGSYTDINPDQVVTAVIPVGSPTNFSVNVTDSLDFNLDGRYDVIWTASASRSQQSEYTRALVKPLHNDLQIAASNSGPLIIAFPLSYRIEAILPQPQPPATATNSWRSISYWNPDAALAYSGYNRLGPFNYSTWRVDDSYMGVRIRSSAAAPWQYGWVRIQVSVNGSDRASLTVKDYGFEQSILSTKMQVIDTWQVYPNPVERVLTLQCKQLGSRQVKLLDVRGRMVLAASSSAHGKQDLDLSSLPAGVYILHLTTAQGTTTKRINKL